MIFLPQKMILNLPRTKRYNRAPVVISVGARHASPTMQNKKKTYTGDIHVAPAKYRLP